MKVQSGKFLLPSLIFAAFLMSCGVASESTMAEIENRIKALTEKGVPDSALSSVKVYRYNVAAAKKISSAGNAKKYTDSMLIAISAAEKWYEGAMVQNKSYLDTKGRDLNARKGTLTGLQLKTADSMFALIDSFSNMNWLVQARTKMEKLDTIMLGLEDSEKKAQDIRNKIVGKWGDAHYVQQEETNYKALDRRIYKFTKDMKFEGSEELKGQTTEFMKEDWQFLSWGSYDIKGDTIFLFITREKCPRQVFTQWHIKDKKWIVGEKPTYDSTVTDGSKDRFMTFDYLKDNFKRM